MSPDRHKFELRSFRSKHESTVKRLFCIECCSMQDAHKVGTAEYVLDCCGATRALMTSEKITQERMEATWEATK